MIVNTPIPRPQAFAPVESQSRAGWCAVHLDARGGPDHARHLPCLWRAGT